METSARDSSTEGATVNTAALNEAADKAALNKDLLTAARNKNKDEILQLLKKGADVNTTDVNGKTSLMLMAGSFCAEGVSILLTSGADVNMVDIEGFSALRYAVDDEDSITAELLIKSGADVTCCKDTDFYNDFEAAAYGGFTSFAKRFIDEGLDAKSLDGNILIKVAHDCFEDVLCLLVEAGVDVNYKDSHHGTALQEACASGLDKGVKALITAGADVNQPECDCTTPLMFAASNGNINCLNLLLEAGADVNLSANLGKTAMILAAWSGHPDCLEILIKAGSDVNFVSGYRHTAITGKYKSRCEDDYKCIQMLIDAGIDINVPDHCGFNSGTTAVLEVAAENDSIKIRMYLKAGLKVNEKDTNNLYVLDNYMYFDAFECDREFAMLLYAAGEQLGPLTLQKAAQKPEGDTTTYDVLNYVLKTDLKFNLKHMCRLAIRNHLLKLNPNLHLFDRIPQLKLPSSLTEYLLYFLSLETGDLIKAKCAAAE